MATYMAGVDGEVNDRHIQHYLERARAHPGFIVVEVTCVSVEGRISSGVLGIDNDRQIPGLRRLAAAVKGEGTPVSIQIAHGGAKAIHPLAGDKVAPSNVCPPGAADTPRALTSEEISTLVRTFGDAAVRAAEAGFDAVELHGAHGYLLSQFLSPYTNRRKDAYGGNLEARLRFPLEVIAEVRRLLGPHFPLAYRLGASDRMPGGLTLEEGVMAAERLEAGGVDLLDISGGLTGDGQGLTEQGYFVYLAEAVKEKVSVPVIGVGNITDPEYADRIIREGRVNLVAVGRAMLTNPNWAADAARQLQDS